MAVELLLRVRQGLARIWAALVRGFVWPVPSPAQDTMTRAVKGPDTTVAVVKAGPVPKSEYARLRQQLRQKYTEGAQIHLPTPDKRWNPLCYEAGGMWEDGSRGVPRGFLFPSPEARADVEKRIGAQMALPHVSNPPAVRQWAPPEQVQRLLGAYWARQGQAAAPCAG